MQREELYKTSPLILIPFFQITLFMQNNVLFTIWSIPCSNGTGTDIIWCNQALFNYAKFSMKSFYPRIPNLPPAPDYVTSHGFGIVDSRMHVSHTKYPRSGTLNKFNYFTPQISYILISVYNECTTQGTYILFAAYDVVRTLSFCAE